VNKEKILKIRTQVHKQLTSTATASHDLMHTQRIVNLAKKIARTEKNVREDLVEIAAWLHDIGRPEEDASKLEGREIDTDHAIIGGKRAKKILKKLDFPKEDIHVVVDAIRAHRFRKRAIHNQPETLEAKILYDADKLDSIGAIGIARAYAYAGEHGYRLYSEYFEEQKDTEAYQGLIKDPKRHTPYLEYEIKLKKIKDTLFTSEAKRIAEKRHKFMEKYFSRLYQEITNRTADLT